jgi:predicted Zn-dependent protease
MIGWRGVLAGAATYSFAVAPASVFDDFGGCAHTAQSLQQASTARDDCKKLAVMPVGTDEEYALGGAAAIRIVSSSALLVDDAAVPSSPKNRLTEYLDLVGKNLGAQSSRPAYKWVFSIIDDKNDPRIDAFSTPGGYVFVTCTLMKRVDNEAQLAAVLAHEISHTTERHAIHLYQQIKGKQCDFAFAGAVAGAGGKAVVGPEIDTLMDSLHLGLLNLDDLGSSTSKLLADLTEDFASKLTSGYEQDQEFDADRIGAELLVTAGYNPYEMISYLHRLPDASFNHHPPHLDREKRLRDWLTTYCAAPDSGASQPLLAADCPFKSYPVVPLPPDIKKIIATL